MIKPYDPRDHRVPGYRSFGRDLLLVLTIFVVLPFAACAIVEGTLRVHVLLAIVGIVGFGGGIIYGVRNMDALEEDERG
jgi:hypothetical protein